MKELCWKYSERISQFFFSAKQQFLAKNKHLSVKYCLHIQQRKSNIIIQLAETH